MRAWRQLFGSESTNLTHQTLSQQDFQQLEILQGFQPMPKMDPSGKWPLAMTSQKTIEMISGAKRRSWGLHLPFCEENGIISVQK
jgi:hypothetical protein